MIHKVASISISLASCWLDHHYASLLLSLPLTATVTTPRCYCHYASLLLSLPLTATVTTPPCYCHYLSLLLSLPLPATVTTPPCYCHYPSLLLSLYITSKWHNMLPARQRNRQRTLPVDQFWCISSYKHVPQINQFMLFLSIFIYKICL